ncbi:15122_t:CDS:2, partial [Funneliformis mosseae]
MSQYQGSITSFLNTPSPDTPSQEDFIQPSRKKIKHKRKKTSWIWAHFIELTDNNESFIICQVLKEDGTACNVKLKYDESTGNGTGHLWSIHKITKDGKQSEDKQQKLN